MKKTLVIGASPNPIRYAYRAVQQLQAHGHQVVALGRRPGEIGYTTIQNGFPELTDIHTISLYLRAEYQRDYYNYILQLSPQRIIFNPGTENADLLKIAQEQHIEAVLGCTLVMLSLGSF